MAQTTSYQRDEITLELQLRHQVGTARFQQFEYLAEQLHRDLANSMSNDSFYTRLNVLTTIKYMILAAAQ